MHCSVGMDRTETLSMLINGLLVVSKKDFTYIEIFGENGDTFASCVEKYMLHIWVSKEKINSIKNILLE